LKSDSCMRNERMRVPSAQMKQAANRLAHGPPRHITIGLAVKSLRSFVLLRMVSQRPTRSNARGRGRRTVEEIESNDSEDPPEKT
jgi:hypothetical protein